MGVHWECHHHRLQIIFHSGDFENTNQEVRIILAGQDTSFLEGNQQVLKIQNGEKLLGNSEKYNK